MFSKFDIFTYKNLWTSACQMTRDPPVGRGLRGRKPMDGVQSSRSTHGSTPAPLTWAGQTSARHRGLGQSAYTNGSRAQGSRTWRPKESLGVSLSATDSLPMTGMGSATTFQPDDAGRPNNFQAVWYAINSEWHAQCGRRWPTGSTSVRPTM